MEISKFDGLMSKRDRVATTKIPDAPEAPAKKAKEPKPLAKSKDPAYKQSSVFLRTKTHAEVHYLVRLMNNGEDISTVIEKLLVDWIAKHKDR